MGTTTNNGWPTPVATDLVKDGWEAIKDLGDAIDTTLGVYAPSTPGLTLINTTSFSAVASTSFPTDSLSATYENYRIVFYISDNTIATGLNFRLRTTVDETGSQYYYNVRRGRASGVGLADSTGNPTTSFAINSVPGAAGRQISGVIDLIAPQLTGITTMSFSAVGTDGTSQISSNGAGYLNTATQYQSATFFVASGNITGKMALYGYNF
jgi:hypothetical protein